MKILNLKIFDTTDICIRDINFNEKGISLIFGDVKKPESKTSTINSIGKTTLLKCIDYIFGGNESDVYIKEEVYGYGLKAVVLFKSKKYTVERQLGNSTMYIDTKKYSISEYKEFFEIERNFYNNQIILSPKGNILGFNKYKSKEDIKNFFEILDLEDIAEKFLFVKDKQDEINILKRRKSNLLEMIGDVDPNEIDQQIYFVDKEISECELELNNLLEKLDEMDVADEQNKILSEYEKLNKRIKEDKYKRLVTEEEIKSMSKFIEDSKNTEITNKHILKLYEKAEVEIPNMIKRTLEEVDSFHNNIYTDRKNYLNENIIEKEKEFDLYNKRIAENIIEFDRLTAVISTNEAYKESMKLSERYNSKLNKLKYEEGRLSQIKQTESLIQDKDDELQNDFKQVSEELDKHKEKIGEIKDYIFELVKNIYDNDVNAYFDVKSVKKHQTNNPLKIELELKGDGGEGIGEIKKIIMDYVVFKFNGYVDILIQDSSCYNGIDNRQIVSLLRELEKIALDENKQAIISINRYQISTQGDNKEKIYKFIEDHSVLNLSEEDKLFGIDY